MTTDAPPDGAVENPHDQELSRRRFLATAWFDLARTLVRTTLGFTPPVASRAFAYAGLALYEAVVPGSRRHQSLQRVMPGLRVPSPGDERLDWPAVANAALASMMRLLFPTTSVTNQAAIDALEASFAGSPDDALYGRAVADGVFAWSRSDGGHEGYLRNFPADYIAPAGPGLWVPTRRRSNRLSSRRGDGIGASPSSPVRPARPGRRRATPRNAPRTSMPRRSRCTAP
jgi:hypothetical protein